MNLLNWDKFEKIDDVNPCLLPDRTSVFFDSVSNEIVNWESKDVFNPAAIVKDGKVYMAYRAEDTVGRFSGTSRIGLAHSEDGRIFTKMSEPVLYPDNDNNFEYEKEGGCEDPRIVEAEDGTYVMTYTAYNGQLARLCVATSEDLINWTKQGSAFSRYSKQYEDCWSKSGSIVTRLVDGKMIATKINGYYWMYFGEGHIFAAKSNDLINWEIIMDFDWRGFGEKSPKYLASPRENKFDSDLIESGPPAVLTDNGIVFIYNSRNKEGNGGDPLLPGGAYTVGILVMDKDSPTDVIYRSTECIMKPDKDYEINGQVGNVCFVEGLVHFNGEWLLYYGTADSKIAVARCDGMR